MKKTFALIALVALLTNSITPVYAESIDLSVSGNGDNSQSSIETSVSNDTNVDQSNDSKVSSDVSNDSNTGNNQANQNTGANTNLQTGDANSQTNVDNTNINQNIVDTNCNCDTDSTLALNITDNGTGSTNNITTSVNQTNQVSQTNTAKINTTVKINANTGNNSINRNTTGNINLSTGDIHEQTNITNQNINNSYASINNSLFSDNVQANISGNGADTNNNLVLNITKDNQIFVTNKAHVNNSVIKHLNTGGNKINGNTATDINLNTGSIFSITNLINKGINTSIAYLHDCIDEDHPEDPSDPGDPSDPDDPAGGHGGPSSNNGGGGSSNGGGDNNSDSGVGGSVLGATLPETGSNSLYFLLANGFIFMAGITLRTRAWRLASAFNHDYQLKFTITY